MHPVLAFLNRALTLMVIFLAIAAGGILYAKYLFDKPGPSTHSTVVVIPRGEGVNGIATRLEDQNIIIDKRLFVVSAMWLQAQRKLKAGEYQIRKAASMREVLDTITQGRSVMHKLTVPEGLTTMQILQRMEEHPMLTGTLTQLPPEGSLLPDTYKFTRGLSRYELVERMQAEQKKFLDRIWETRVQGLPIKTKEEAIILASIVEKETGRSDERRRVAGVFINRLKKNMRLQSDPTIIYGLVGGKGTLGRGIKRSELDKKTAYNTYQIDGLPPGPIANPGRASLEAVLNPADTKDLFFVADGTGGHIFAATLADHNRNVRNWRKIEKEMRAKQAAAAKAAAEQQPTAPTLPGVQIATPGQTIAPSVPKVPPFSTSTSDNTSAATPAETMPGAKPVPLPIRKPTAR